MTERDHDLTQEEQQLLTEYESGELQSVRNLDQRKRDLQSAVRDTQNKTRNINIRLSEKDLSRLKAKAIEEGIPYQTLVSSILHKAVSSYRTDMPTPSHLPFFLMGSIGQTYKEDSK